MRQSRNTEILIVDLIDVCNKEEEEVEGGEERRSMNTNKNKIEYPDAASLEADHHLYSNYLSSRSGSQYPRKATVFFKEPLVQRGKFALCGIDHETKDGTKKMLAIECRCDSGKPCALCIANHEIKAKKKKEKDKEKKTKPLIFSYSSWRRFLKLHKNKESIVNPKKRAASVDLDDVNASSSPSPSPSHSPSDDDDEEKEKDNESQFFTCEDWLRFLNEHNIGRVDPDDPIALDD